MKKTFFNKESIEKIRYNINIMYVVKISNGKITIPVKLRKELGIFGKRIKTSGYLDQNRFVINLDNAKNS